MEGLTQTIEGLAQTVECVIPTMEGLTQTTEHLFIVCIGLLPQQKHQEDRDMCSA